MREPHFGFTRLGHPVHARAVDHLPVDSRYQRVNKRLALFITANVGTMSCFWLFCVLSLLALPATLVAAHVLAPGELIPAFLSSTGFILVITWIAQTFFQLVLLPALMVGQNLQSQAADARAAKTFEDVESIAATGDATHALLRAVVEHLGVATPEGGSTT